MPRKWRFHIAGDTRNITMDNYGKLTTISTTKVMKVYIM
jgi:hypothetical protein